LEIELSAVATWAHRVLPLAHGSRDLYGMVSTARLGRVLRLGAGA
jgi:hypothetical protein